MTPRGQALRATGKWLASLMLLATGCVLLAWFGARIEKYVGTYGTLAFLIGVPVLAGACLVYRMELRRFSDREGTRKAGKAEVAG